MAAHTPVFYIKDISGEELFLSEEESKHCIRVLRMKKGDPVTLVNGKGMEVVAVIGSDHPKKCMLQVTETKMHAADRSYRLHIAIAPTKRPERMEWFIEKGVEAGIDEISFINCKNSERDTINSERMEKIAISAMKQSRQFYLPLINPLRTFKSCISDADPDAMKMIAWCETPEEQNIRRLLTRASSVERPPSVFMLIGPEGDFTPEETAAASSKGFLPVSLGRSILRTETAALYACMAVKTLFS